MFGTLLSVANVSHIYPLTPPPTVTAKVCSAAPEVKVDISL